jgi:hypothetical protein
MFTSLFAVSLSLLTVPNVHIADTDYAEAVWLPAHELNFGQRPEGDAGKIEYVIIHDIEGLAEFATNWFMNPESQVSAHYTLSADGRVYQQVREKDNGWHCGNSAINRKSIGIEHEGFAYKPDWYQLKEYETSAKLVRDITTRHRIPRDRKHIIGHNEVPDPTDPTKFGGRGHHTDPGPYWDWDTYMTLVRNDAGEGKITNVPAIIHPGEKLPITVTLTNTGDDVWGADPREAATDRSGVYLGTEGGNECAFWHMGWVSPRLCAMAKAAPGATASITFDIQGDKKYGEKIQTLRLWKVNAAPKSPVAFGESVSFSIKVTPWDVRVKKGEIGWAASLPISGNWMVYVTDKASTKTPFMLGKDTLIPAKKTAQGWRSLGTVALKKGEVTITNADPKQKVDLKTEMRFVGPF